MSLQLFRPRRRRLAYLPFLSMAVAALAALAIVHALLTQLGVRL